MPKIARMFIKAGMLFFAGAMLLAVFISLQGVFPSWPFAAGLIPVFWHLLFVGWITQIIIGVSIWMFPRQSREAPRGNLALARASFYLLNTGLVLRAVAEPWQTQADFFSWILAASALLQWAGGLCYVLMIWPRVRGKKKRIRRSSRSTSSSKSQTG